MFEYMDITTLEAVFTAQGAGRLPEYLGSTIRGILGHCFRDFVCDSPNTKCFVCSKQSDCHYVRSFASTGGKGGAVNPFVLWPCTYGKAEWKKGDDCVFRLTLFGYAAKRPGIYMDALFAMEGKGWGAERIPFKLNRVTDWEQGALLYAAGRSWLRNLSPHTMKVGQVNPRCILVSFRTPVRIIAGGELFQTLPFQEFLRFLMGRFLLMTQVYTDYMMEWDREKMLNSAARVKTVAEQWDTVNFTRYSMNSADGRLELPARTGWVLYEGDLAAFVPYLAVGGYLHVGKNTTIGFGKYTMYYDDEVTL